jgi:hypothetical protein
LSLRGFLENVALPNPSDGMLETRRADRLDQIIDCSFRNGALGEIRLS